mmetsp:Transcript_100870/g.260716  ORF Transcript_100870/g.260716 Transcript_100870/m.260716 type:complete len:271 (-) Transcript_100870:1766-2578(-)
MSEYHFETVLKIEGPRTSKTAKMESSCEAALLTTFRASRSVLEAVGTRFVRECSTSVTCVHTPERPGTCFCSILVSVFSPSSEGCGPPSALLTVLFRLPSTPCSSWSIRPEIWPPIASAAPLESVSPSVGTRTPAMFWPVVLLPMTLPRMSPIGSVMAPITGFVSASATWCPMTSPACWMALSRAASTCGAAVVTRPWIRSSMTATTSFSAFVANSWTWSSKRWIPAGVAYSSIIRMKLWTRVTMAWICVAKLSMVLDDCPEYTKHRFCL